MNDRPRAAAVFGVVFLSGGSALVFENLLFRLSGLALGNSVWAVTIVLGSFMAGLAVGNGLLALRGHRFRQPLRAYALLEGVIGVSGLSLVIFLPWLQHAVAPVFRSVVEYPWLVGLLRGVLAFTWMLVPAAAMGMTLPVLVGALLRRSGEFGPVLGGIYGWNTLGAVAGALAAERVLVEHLGITGAGCAAAAGNLLAGCGALLLARRGSAAREGVAAGESAALMLPEGWGGASRGRLARASLLAAAFLCGGILLALEVIWFRFFLMFVPALAWNLAVMLAIVLAGIGLGGLLGAAWLRSHPAADRQLTGLALLAGALVAGLYRGLLMMGGSIDEGNAWLWQLYLMLPVSVISGVLFTLVGQALQRHGGSAIRTAAQATMSNTVGAALGSLAGGLLLIPLAGMERSFCVLAGAYGLVALLAVPTLRPEGRWYASGWGTAWLAALVLFPFGATQEVLFAVPEEVERMGVTRVLYREGLTETIQYFRKELAGKPWFYVLRTNHHPMSSTALESQRYMKLYVYWPVAVRPDMKDALLISYGVGGTAKALTDTRSLRSIDVVDISRDILEAGSVVYPDSREAPLHDPRVRVHVEDGRFFLLTTRKSYDLVTAEPPPPRHSGVGNLYSREYFELVRDRLNDGGIVTYWLPVYQLQADEAKAIQRAFQEVFPQCSLWTANHFEWMMVGVKGEIGPPTAEAFSRQWHDPVVGPELQRLGFRSPAQFGSLFIADGRRLADWVKDVPPLVDDHPQRLRSRPVAIGPESFAEYLAFMNDPAAEENFAASPLIARAWPAELRSAAREHFPARIIINNLLTLQQPDVWLLHETLTNPLLTGYAAWALKGNGFAQDLVRGLSPEALQSQLRAPDVWWNLAADAVSRGEYALAARHLAVPFQQSGQPIPGWCVQVQIYLCLRSGETARAEALRDAILQETADMESRRRIVAFYDWAVGAARQPAAPDAPLPAARQPASSAPPHG